MDLLPAALPLDGRQNDALGALDGHQGHPAILVPIPVVYPGFGWEGYSVDCTISADSPEAMKWCHDHGLIDHTTKNFYGKPLLRFCRERAPKCATVLEKLGHPE